VNNKSRGQKIRKQILRDVIHHPRDIAAHISGIFSITPQAVYNHLRKLEDDKRLITSGKRKGKHYFLGDLREYESVFQLTPDFAEDKVWRSHFSFIFDDLPENIVDICYYGFTEMVNNVIDHSGGNEVFISISRDDKYIKVYVMDNGEGIFKRITRLCKLADERQALLELSKGKFTTDPDNHTGEGIFFTSRVFDEFEIDSKGLRFTHNEDFDFDFMLESELPMEQIGTVVRMFLDRNTTRETQDIYDKFTAGPDEYQFNKTIVPVRLAQYENEKLVSRSQAKRLLSRIENFEVVIFDFQEVKSVGQAFADEIFRVYAIRNPQLKLIPINMEINVEKMVNKAIQSREVIEEQNKT